MFCKHCGQQIDDTSNACPHCGTGVTRKYSDTNPTGSYNSQVPPTGYYKPNTQMTVHMSEPYQPDKPENKKKNIKKIIIAVVSLILVAAIVAGTLFFLKYRKEQEELEHRERLAKVLEESTNKPIIELYYDDYDDNGITEAFALVGKNSKGEGEDVKYTDADIYFVNEKAAQIIDEKVSGETNGILTSDNVKYISLENTKNKDDVGYSYIYGVKNNKPFESATSGIYHEVHQDGDKIVGKQDVDGKFIEITVSSEELNIKADYESIINQHKEVVKNRLDLEDAKENFGEHVNPALIINLSSYRNYGNKYSENTARLYHSIFDINDDGIDECVIGMGENESSIKIYSMFTYDRKNAVSLFDFNNFTNRSLLTLYDNGTLYLNGNISGDSAHSHKYYTLPLNSCEVELIEELVFENYQYYKVNKNGTKEEISDESFHDIQNEYKSNEIKLKWTEIKYGSEDPTVIPEPQVGDIIEYGSYPQTEVTNPDTIASLNASAANWVSYSYYAAKEDDPGFMVQGDYMMYTDVFLSGEKYRGVKFTQYRPVYTASFSSAENSFQDENGYNANSVYWFKYEPLEWRILDPETGLVMCESIIDSQPFSSTIYLDNGEYYIDEESSNYTNNYSTSSIRSWLNREFINLAFENYQQNEILTTNCKNIDPNNDSHGYPEVNDRIFLPAYEEMMNADYGFNADATLADNSRVATGTDYAKCQGLNVSSSSNHSGNSWYFLRSPLEDTRNTSAVAVNGSLSGKMGIVDGTDGGIRPAMRLSDLSLL